jgi:hypothetical protein
VQIVFYTIYKTTDKLNGKIYIGKHQTKNLDDGYVGSGKLLTCAIKKHGIENFEKEILYIFDNEDDMNAKEAELVTSEFVKEDTNYNLCPGGHGGWGYINANNDIRAGFETRTDDDLKKLNIELAKRASKKLKILHETDLEWKKHWAESISDGLKKYYAAGNENPFKGKSHTEETRKKIGLANSKCQSGKGNSQYGTVWITNGSQNKKMKKGEDMPEGWHKGRM